MVPKVAAEARKMKNKNQMINLLRSLSPIFFKYKAATIAITAKIASVIAVVCSVGISINSTSSSLIDFVLS